MSRTRSEIAEQPAVLARLLEREAPTAERIAASAARLGVRSVVIAARGSSANAGRYGQHLLGRMCALPVSFATPSLHTLYGSGPSYRDSLVIGVSQSGSSPDVVGVVADARAQGALTLAITNDPDSELAGAAAELLDLNAGAETAVAATKTYTASLAAFALLAVTLGRKRLAGVELAGLPGAVSRQLELGSEADSVASAYTDQERWTVVARGVGTAAAFEGALKLKELTGASAEAWSAADLRHGPVAVVDSRHLVLGIAPRGPALADVDELLDTVRARGARVVTVTDSPVPRRRGERSMELASVPEWLSPVVAAVPLQLLAVAISELRGVDTDSPFGLHKVTRTL